LGAIISRKGEREEGRFLLPKMVLAFRGRSLISTFPILLLILCHNSLIHSHGQGPRRVRVHLGRRGTPRDGSDTSLLWRICGMFQSVAALRGLFLLLLQQSLRDGSAGQQGPASQVPFFPFSFSKYVRTCEPGLHYVNPITEEMVVVDCRISVASLPSQRLMTRGTF